MINGVAKEYNSRMNYIKQCKYKNFFFLYLEITDDYWLVGCYSQESSLSTGNKTLMATNRTWSIVKSVSLCIQNCSKQRYLLWIAITLSHLC